MGSGLRNTRRWVVFFLPPYQPGGSHNIGCYNRYGRNAKCQLVLNYGEAGKEGRGMGRVVNIGNAEC